MSNLFFYENTILNFIYTYKHTDRQIPALLYTMETIFYRKNIENANNLLKYLQYGAEQKFLSNNIARKKML